MPHKFLPLCLSSLYSVCTAKVAITSCLDLINRRKSSATEKRASSSRDVNLAGKTRQGRRKMLGLNLKYVARPMTPFPTVSPVAYLTYLMLFNFHMIKH